MQKSGLATFNLSTASRSDYFKGARLSILPVFPMSEIIDRVVLGSCRFTGTNPERGAPGHLILGGVLHQAHVKLLKAFKMWNRNNFLCSVSLCGYALGRQAFRGSPHKSLLVKRHLKLTPEGMSPYFVSMIPEPRVHLWRTLPRI